MQLAGEHLIFREHFRSRFHNELPSSLDRVALQGENKFFGRRHKGERTSCLGHESSRLFLRRNDDQSEITRCDLGATEKFRSTDSKRMLRLSCRRQDPLTLLLSSLGRFSRKLNDICRGTSTMKQTNCLDISLLHEMQLIYVQKILALSFVILTDFKTI